MKQLKVDSYCNDRALNEPEYYSYTIKTKKIFSGMRMKKKTVIIFEQF